MVTHPMVREIQDHLTRLHARKEIGFCWIPSHVGIPGNEQVDFLAKQACKHDSATLPIPYQDLISPLRRHFSELWQLEWSGVARPTQLRSVKPQVGRWSSSYRSNRREEVVLSRLRLGHTRLTHGHLLVGENRPACEVCHADLDVQHILVDCPLYDQLWWREHELTNNLGEASRSEERRVGKECRL